MKSATIPAHAVKVGDTVLAHGIRWTVSQNLYDPDGGENYAPRRVLVCDAHPEDVAEAGAFAKGLHLGMRDDEPTTVIVGGAK